MLLLLLLIGSVLATIATIAVAAVGVAVAAAADVDVAAAAAVAVPTTVASFMLLPPSVPQHQTDSASMRQFSVSLFSLSLPLSWIA